MALSEFSIKYHEIMFPGFDLTAPGADSEVVERFDNFAFDEVINHPGLEISDHDRWLAILACLIGCQGIDEYKLTAHAVGNMRLGNDRAYPIRIVSAMLPFIGYPRSLNAIECIRKAAEQMNA